MKVYFGAKTDPGRRSNNEDSHTVIDVDRGDLNADGVILVADGMGGRNFGEAASSAAIDAVRDSLVDYLRANQPTAIPVTDALAAALRKANSRVYALSQADPSSQGMGTTLVAAVINGTKLNLAHVGDSRAYLFGVDGLEQITDDHSFVADQVRAGNISEDGAKKSRFRNVITRAVGIEPTVAPDLDQFDLSNANSLVVCTDGLTNAVSDEEIAHILSTAPTAQGAADQLVDAAVENGGKDNITVVVSRFGSNDPIRKGVVGKPAPRPAMDTVDDDDSMYLAVPAAKAKPKKTKTQKRPHGTMIAILGVVCVMAIGAASYFGSVLYGAGYVFTVSPPFVSKPVAPAPPAPTDLTNLAYAAPVKALDLPIQHDPMYVASNGSISVLTQKNQVVTLNPLGQIAQTTALSPVVAGYLHSKFSTEAQHTARDAKGDLYVANPQLKSIAKFDPSGRLLGQIATGKLHDTGAISVRDDGTVFVIDSDRLWSIQATPATEHKSVPAVTPHADKSIGSKALVSKKSNTPRVSGGGL